MAGEKPPGIFPDDPEDWRDEEHPVKIEVDPEEEVEVDLDHGEVLRTPPIDRKEDGHATTYYARITRSSLRHKGNGNKNVATVPIVTDPPPVPQRRTPGMKDEEWIPIRNENARKYRAWKQKTMTPKERKAFNAKASTRVKQRREAIGKDKIREVARAQFARRKARMTPEELKAYHDKRNQDAKLRRQQMTPEEKTALYKRLMRMNKLNLLKKAGKTVEKIPHMNVKSQKNVYKISLLEHCVFCLRITTTQKGMLQSIAENPDLAKRALELPRVDEDFAHSTHLLTTLNRTWDYYQEGDNWNWHKVQDPQSTQFPSLPTMCQICAEKLDSVRKLMNELAAGINILGKVILDSRFRDGEHFWRAERFRRAVIRSFVEVNVRNDTMEFFNIENFESWTRWKKVDGQQEGPSSSRKRSMRQDRRDSDEDDDESNQSDVANNDPDYNTEEDESGSSDSDDDTSLKNDNIVSEDEGGAIDEPTSSETNFIAPVSNIVSVAQEIVSESTPLPKTSCDITPSSPNESNALPAVSDTTVLPILDPVTGKQWYTCLIDGCGQRIRRDGGNTYVKSHQRKVHRIGVDKSFICDICDLGCVSERGLRTHIRKIHQEGKMRGILCDLCKERVPVRDCYEHARAHVGDEYLLKCPNASCPRVFCTTYSLFRHLKSNNSCRSVIPDVEEKYMKKTFACETCGTDMGNMIGLREHILRLHENGPKIYPCPIEGCQQQFSVRQSVPLHLYRHRGKPDFCVTQTCDVCQEEIKIEEMGPHLSNSHNIQEGIKCTHCSFFFTTRENMIGHLFKHTHSGTLFCDICGEDGPRFTIHAKLCQHYITVHQIKPTLVCEKCQKPYYSTRALEDHISKEHIRKRRFRKKPNRSIAKEAKKSFKCGKCDAVYSLMRTLTQHEINDHGAEHPLCKFCPQRFSNLNDLQRHEREHMGIANTVPMITCPEEGCGKILTNKKYLKSHLITAHGAARPHVCELCEKAYITLSQLTRHRRSVHTGERPHKCDVCGEGFTSSAILRRHKMIHTGERPFACEICDQRFRYKEVLKRHVAGHEKKGADFKPNGSMKQTRKRVQMKRKCDS